MTDYTVWGNFIEPGEGREYLIIQFSPTSIPLQERWRNNGLSADFLAEYWATFFPARDAATHIQQQEIRAAISYIANELLENIMKFSYIPGEYAVSLSLYLYEDVFRFYTRNAIDPQFITAFRERVQQMLQANPDDLYIAQVERNATHPDGGSHLGLLTMICDYHAQLAWKFEPAANHSGVEIVTTMVQLKL